MLRYFMLLSITAIASGHDNEIHKSMTPEEVQSVFKTDHENVPEYDVVQTVHAIHENSPEDSVHRILHLKSFKRDIKLYLEPTEGILAGKHTPVWKAQGDPSSPEGIKYTRIANAMDDGSIFYQDPYNLAAFYSTQDEHGDILFEGTIGDDLVVRAIPKRLRKVLSRKKRSVPEDYFAFSNRTVTHPNIRQTYDHIVYRNKEVNRDGIREKLGPHILEKREVYRQKRSQGETFVNPPKTVYPQVLVTVDYSHFQSLQTLAEVKRYVISFWNAVDLRYRVFVDPEVRLNIAGIIITMDPDGIPYIQNHRTRPFDGPIVDADETLDHMGNYFFIEHSTPGLKRFDNEAFDIAVTLTQLDLCNRDPIDRDFDCTTLGYAFRQGACTATPRLKLAQGVALVEDNGGYIGIVPAAHEVGHLLGARHDGYEEDDEVKCPNSKGHIMSGILMCNKNVFKWSSCSMEDFQQFFHHPRAQCLFNKPPHSRPVRRILPGKIYSLDEQCDRIEGTRACNHDESACTALNCLIPGAGGQCRAKAPAAEGSSCGLNHYCINGKCVHKNTTEIDLEPPSETESSEEYYYQSPDDIFKEFA